MIVSSRHERRCKTTRGGHFVPAARAVPITYQLDQAVRLVRATVEGDFTAEDMLDCVSSAARELEHAGWNILSDHRAIGAPATRAQIERLVDRLYDLRRVFAGARWAVVVAQPASYGMMRMLSTLAEEVPLTVRVFGELEGAEGWARDGTEPAPASERPAW